MPNRWKIEYTTASVTNAAVKYHHRRLKNKTVQAHAPTKESIAAFKAGARWAKNQVVIH